MAKLDQDHRVTQVLEALEDLIDVAHVQAAEKRQRAALLFEPVDRRPTIITVRDDWRNIQHDRVTDWPLVTDDAFFDPAQLLIRELERVYAGALLRDDRAYTVRVDYGGLAGASLFGCVGGFESGMFPRLRPVADRATLIRALNQGVPDLDTGLFSQVWDAVSQWQAWLASYPQLHAVVRIGVPEMTGPLTLLERVTGSAFAVWAASDLELACDLLAVMTDTTIAIAQTHAALTDHPANRGLGFSYCLRGGGVFSDIGLNGCLAHEADGLYEYFVKPCVVRVGEALGGTTLYISRHSAALFDAIVATPGVTAVSFADPDLENFAQCYWKAAAQQVALLWDGEILPEDEHTITGVIHKRLIPNWQDALAVAKVLYGRVR